jgi:glycosyltransferase involved in cell wall biosynthesis
MKIAYLSSSTIPSQKANSIQVMKMCNALSNLGNEVTLFVKPSDNNEKTNIKFIKKYYGIENIHDIYFISASSIRLIGGIEYGYKILRKIETLKLNLDILYGRNLYALMTCLKLKKPIIYESHAAPSKGREYLEKYLFSRKEFKRLVVINKKLYDFYKNNFSIFKKSPEKIIIAEDGADIPNFINNTTYDYEIKNKPIIGYAGSLYPGKGIETIAKIADIMPNITFLIAGGNINQIDSYKRNYKLNNLIFKSFISPSDIPLFLSNCNILLAPYQDKVFSDIFKTNNLVDWMSPLKIFEYMASKKPIIASNLPSVEEILEDKKTALLVDYNNISDWQKAIKEILCKPDLAKKISENAFEKLKNNYTWSTRSKKVLQNLNLSISEEKTQINKPVILHIIGDLNVGGTERNLLKILPKLNNKKYQCKVLTLFEPGLLAKDLKYAGIDVISLNIPRTILNIKTFSALIKLIKYIKKLKPVIIHTWLYHSNNLINILSPFFKQIPIINSIRHDNPEAGSFKTKLSSKIGAFFSRLFNRTTVYCSKSSMIKHINNNYSYKNSFVIPNGFLISNIEKSEAQPNLRQKLNIPSNYKIAIIVGRYCIEKDYPTLLKAIKIVTEKHPNVLFLFCGKGLDRNNKELQEQISNLKIENKIILLGIQSNIENLMAGGDFFISSSNSESFPNVIAESMSVGTPCIATEVGDTANIIGSAGIIVPHSNSKKTAEAIINFLKLNNKQLELLGQKAKERIRDNYSLNSCINQYEQLYSSILANSVESNFSS